MILRNPSPKYKPLKLKSKKYTCDVNSQGKVDAFRVDKR